MILFVRTHRSKYARKVRSRCPCQGGGPYYWKFRRQGSSYKESLRLICRSLTPVFLGALLNRCSWDLNISVHSLWQGSILSNLQQLWLTISLIVLWMKCTGVQGFSILGYSKFGLSFPTQRWIYPQTRTIFVHLSDWNNCHRTWSFVTLILRWYQKP